MFCKEFIELFVESLGRVYRVFVERLWRVYGEVVESLCRGCGKKRHI